MPDPAAPRGGLIFLSLLTFAVLVFEIILTRLFAYLLPYHLTAVSVSLAVMGLGLGAYARARFAAAWEGRAVLAAGAGGFSASLLALAAAAGFGSALLLGIAAWIAFLFLGAMVSYFYDALWPKAAHNVYVADLLGAALACLSVVPLMERTGPLVTFGVLAALSAVVAGALAKRKGRIAAIAWLVGLTALFIVQGRGWGIGDLLLKSPLGREKALKKSIAREGGRVVDHDWSAMGRADLYEHPDYPGVKWIYNDGTNSTLFLREPRTPENIRFLKNQFSFLPFALAPAPDVLLLGPGGGWEIAMARAAGAARIHAVEVHSGIIRLVRRWRAFAGPVYDAPDVRLHVEEGRRYLTQNATTYDLIQMSLVLTATAQSGTYALAETGLYTVEAFELYLSRLKPTGQLALIDDSFERSVRQAVTALGALQKRGMDEITALSHLMAVADPRPEATGYRFLLRVSAAPVTPEAAERMAALCAERGLDALWIPGKAARGPFAALRDMGLDRFLREHPLDMTACADDRPYFFNFAKGWRAKTATLRPYVLLALAALIAAWFLRRLPLKGRENSAKKITPDFGAAFGIGACFMAVEIGLLQKLSLAAGGPFKVLPVVLFGLLLFCGIGGRAAGAFSRKGRAGLAAALLTVAGVVTLTAILIDATGIASRPPSGGAFVIFLWLAPIGIALGTPFSTLLGIQPQGRSLADLWAANGIGAVFGAALATMISTLGGHSLTLFAGAAGYALLAGLKRMSGGSPSHPPASIASKAHSTPKPATRD